MGRNERIKNLEGAHWVIVKVGSGTDRQREREREREREEPVPWILCCFQRESTILAEN
jgi:hypothetical protein